MVGNAADNPASSMAEAGREVRAEYAKIDGEVTGELALYRGPYLPILGARLDTAINPFVGVLMSMLERSEEHTSELQSLMRISYAVFCLKKKTHDQRHEQGARYYNYNQIIKDIYIQD